MLVGELVEFLGGHAWPDVRHEHFQHLGGESAGDAHVFDLLGGLDGDGHGSSGGWMAGARVRSGL